MSDSIAENKSLKAGDGEPNPTQKRTSDYKVPNSTANKKSKTENDENPEVVGSENAGSEVENDKPVSREMGFEIEADAAEDKGSRHSMEDAWVVLLDAALDYPSKLRFLFIPFFSLQILIFRSCSMPYIWFFNLLTFGQLLIVLMKFHICVYSTFFFFLSLLGRG